jgi:3',5'-cyclic AMP phosphodiesterase CpdA
MFVLAHLSDLHLAKRPRLAELAGKRGLGFVNWHRGRKHIHRIEVLNAVTDDLKTIGADHIAVTGDLVNFSLDGEYALARAWLGGLGPANAVTVVPGNHDAYVGAARNGPARHWAEYMHGDGGSVHFPFVRQRGPVTLIGLSSAVPTGPFMATGELGDAQLSRLAQALERTRDTFRIVLIHHPPESPPNRYLRRLTDGTALRRVLAAHGAELVIHGHDHVRSRTWLDGPQTGIPIIGAPSASARVAHRNENRGGYNIFQIDGEAGTWRCVMIAREYGANGRVAEVARENVLPPSTSRRKALDR